MDAVATRYVTLSRLAGRLGLPASWLRAEAEAGRIPHLKVGRSLRFDQAAVEAALADRAATARHATEEVACG